MGKMWITRDQALPFKEVFRQYIQKSEGRQIQLLRGVNTVIEVNETRIRRESINGKKSWVPVDVIRYAYEALLKSPNGKVERVDEILKYAKAEHHSLCSSFVVAILDQVPYISREDGSKALQLNIKK